MSLLTPLLATLLILVLGLLLLILGHWLTHRFGALPGLLLSLPLLGLALAALLVGLAVVWETPADPRPGVELAGTVMMLCAGIVVMLTGGGGLGLAVIALRAARRGHWLGRRSS